MGKIYLQMYSFMDGDGYHTKENLKAAASMGYDGVELFGPDLELPAEELRASLEENGLSPISLHAPVQQVIKRLPLAKELGMEFIGIGMEAMPGERDVYAFAEKLNEVGKACREQGLMLTYHNHTQEFAPCGDKKIMDVLMERTDPESVGFELDAGWCAAAGFDPAAFIRQYSGRIKLVHIKESSEVIGVLPCMDFSKLEKDEKGQPVFTPEMVRDMDRSKKINCPAGNGIVDWKQLKETADEHGCKAYIVEREYTYAGTRPECLKADIAYYRTVM